MSDSDFRLEYLYPFPATRLRFEINPVDADQSRLKFTHVGLIPLECGETCSSIWSFFLGQSLNRYFRTGTGPPARPHAA